MTYRRQHLELHLNSLKGVPCRFYKMPINQPQRSIDSFTPPKKKIGKKWCLFLRLSLFVENEDVGFGVTSVQAYGPAIQNRAIFKKKHQSGIANSLYISKGDEAVKEERELREYCCVIYSYQWPCKEPELRDRGKYIPPYCKYRRYKRSTFMEGAGQTGRVPVYIRLGSIICLLYLNAYYLFGISIRILNPRYPEKCIN